MTTSTHGASARTRRHLALPVLLAAVLVGASWAPDGEGQSRTRQRSAVPAAPAEIPDVVDTVAAAVPVDGAVAAPQTPPRLAPSVIVHQPDVLVEFGTADPAAPLATIAGRRDVDYVAGAHRFEATLDSGSVVLGDHEQTVGSDEPLTLLAVDAMSFRPLTPSVTANAVAVWDRLLAGDAVIGHDVAFRRGLELGDRIVVATERGTQSYRIGALAATASASVADVIVSVETVTSVAEPHWNVALVAGNEGTGSVWLGERLVESLGGGTFERLDRPAANRVAGWDALETFSYSDIGDGRIQILGDWVSRFIVTVDLPIVGRTQCNRLMVPQLFAALNEVVEAGLAHLIDANDFGGCWTPRHIDWNLAKPLSMHAWGLAVDLNVATNGLGAVPTMDPRIVQVFHRWGFWWGGWWDRPDGMHFQVNRFVEVG